MVTVPPGGHYQVSGQQGAGWVTIAPGLSEVRAARAITVIVGSGHAGIGYAHPAPIAPAGR